VPLSPTGAVEADLMDAELPSISSSRGGRPVSSGAGGLSIGVGSSWRMEMRVSSDALEWRDLESMLGVEEAPRRVDEAGHKIEV
jgi:hypothetical protein